MFTPEELAQEYSVVLKFAASKASYKWGAFLRSFSEADRPFSHEDIDHIAMEGLMVGFGVYASGRKSVDGYLLRDSVCGSDGIPTEKAVQHHVDWYVSSWCQKAAQASRRDCRKGIPARLDEPVAMGYEGDGGGTSYAEMDANRNAPDESEGIIEHLSGRELHRRFPLLYARHVDLFTYSEVMERWGLTKSQYTMKMRKETEAFRLAYADRVV